MPSNLVAPVTRVLIAADPFAHLKNDVFERGQWPCSWIAHRETPAAPFVVAFRKIFTLERDAKIRAHISADERYELFLDGVRVGRGSERGDAANWFFETYDFDLNSGDHVLVARVWSLGEGATTPGIAAPNSSAISGKWVQASTIVSISAPRGWASIGRTAAAMAS